MDKTLLTKARASVLFLALAACSPGEEAAVPLEKAEEPAQVPVDIPFSTIDPDSGLLIDDHWELVRAHCSACHSVRLVTQNRGDRQTWLAMIRWMQSSQGLWEFDTETESRILDYLEKNYAPSTVHRRAPIDRALMPDNPYSKDG